MVCESGRVEMVTLFSEINECNSDPCLNGATCLDAINQFMCECVDGYTDDTCSTGNKSRF